MNTGRSFWPSLSIGLSPIWAFISSVAIMIVSGIFCLVVLFALINSPFIYNAREDLDSYTGNAVSSDSRIEHFMVRNFFLLDGPDYYYALKLTPTDRAQLIAFFKQKSQGWSSGVNADAVVPASWLTGGKGRAEQYFWHDDQTDSQIMLSIDPASNRAWLVVYTM